MMLLSMSNCIFMKDYCFKYLYYYKSCHLIQPKTLLIKEKYSLSRFTFEKEILVWKMSLFLYLGASKQANQSQIDFSNLIFFASLLFTVSLRDFSSILLKEEEEKSQTVKWRKRIDNSFFTNLMEKFIWLNWKILWKIAAKSDLKVWHKASNFLLL